MKTEGRILIVDDDALTVKEIIEFLRLKGYEVTLVETGAAALEVIRRENIGLTLLDLQLRGENGLDLIPLFKKLCPEMSVIIFTGFGKIKDAVEAMRRGADNFVDKCAGITDFLTIIQKEWEANRLRRKNVRLKRLTTPVQPVILAESSAMIDVLQLAEAVAARDATVLLCGETGTGKELIARRIHELSSRSKEPFVEVNSAALPRELAEAELFGSKPGGFTGAVDRVGLFEAADGGTLFLDEIGEMDLFIQAKLLKVLEDGKLRRVGSQSEIEVDVRLIAATNRNLKQLVAANQFRTDLFHRLNVFTINVPSLRERREDILPLAGRFLHEHYSTQVAPPQISREAERILLDYDWPGNVRELRYLIERISIIYPLTQEILPLHLQKADVTLPEKDSNTSDSNAARSREKGFVPRTLEEIERQYVEETLEFCEWHVRPAARMLGIAHTTLYEKMEKYHLSNKDRHEGK
jgi:two-component system, NtrC family, response regulator AtoC